MARLQLREHALGGLFETKGWDIWLGGRQPNKQITPKVIESLIEYATNDGRPHAARCSCDCPRLLPSTFCTLEQHIHRIEQSTRLPDLDLIGN
jgi:hypothetical protein